MIQEWCSGWCSRFAPMAFGGDMKSVAVQVLSRKHEGNIKP